jgi:hypothetical protein
LSEIFKIFNWKSVVSFDQILSFNSQIGPVGLRKRKFDWVEIEKRAEVLVGKKGLVTNYLVDHCEPKTYPRVIKLIHGYLWHVA